jgi:HK97 family phage major capsid protein
MPFASAHFADDDVIRDTRDMVIAGQAIDPEEIRHLRKAHYQKDLSWNTDTAGGTLVPAPAQGELITLLRNKAALMEAGSRVVPMPAQGSVSFPKQTGASTAYWVGENTTITSSNITTGNLLLRAKKLAARVLIPNELFRYSSPAADALVREDLALQLQLGLDTAGLTGVGSDTTPKGIFNYTINSYTPKKQGINGDAFGPEDFFGMIGAVAAQNAIVNEESFAFVVRPQLFYNIVSKRADAVSAGDRQGSFIQWSFDPQGNITYRAAGKRVVVSNQIAADRTKAGSGATLTRVLGGDFSQWIIAMAAALEIDQNRYSDTAYTKDQTDVRAILQVDMGARHEESFASADYLRVDATSA